MKLIKFIVLLLLTILLSACAGVFPKVPVSTNGDYPVLTNVTSTGQASTNTPALTRKMAVTSSVTATVSPIPPTSTKTLTPTPTPNSLETFSSTQLRNWVMPVSYIDDVCTYIENRWGEGKSEPGTIVVPFMFHSIAKPGREIMDNTTMAMEDFEYFMIEAKELGFSTITTEELIGFLQENNKIPQRSLLLIKDDRSSGVTELFMPYLEEYDWTLTLGWPTTDRTNEALWEKMEELAESGRLDVQSHGHDHIYIQDFTPIEEIEEEIYKPIEVIQEHFGTTPKAIIWPGGNFTKASINIAQEAGFKVGFSVYSNGPILYNWIPLREEQAEMDAPMMVLPRYWSPDGLVALKQALAISQEAVEFAEKVKEEELQYFSTYCQSTKSE